MTGYLDPLFPIQAPAFLFCYDTTIVRLSQTVQDTDEAGWPIHTDPVMVATRGYVSAPDTRSLSPAGEAVDAVVRYPRGTVIGHADRIDVPDTNPLPPQLIGRFRVEQVRPTAADLRIMVTRISDPDGSEP